MALVVLAAILLGCGGSTPAAVVTVAASPSAPSDPIVGTWKGDVAGTVVTIDAPVDGDYLVTWDADTEDEQTFFAVREATNTYTGTDGDDTIFKITGADTMTATYTTVESETTTGKFTRRGSDAALTSDEAPSAPTTTTSANNAPSKAEYKRSCRTIRYKVLEKDADSLIGRKYRFTGEVFQIMDAGKGQYFSEFGDDIYPRTQILLSVTRDGWGYWDDQILVLFDKGIHVYEDDIIKVWGKCRGSYTYESVAGYNITVPVIHAKYIKKM
jgi:hypothetical protein